MNLLFPRSFLLLQASPCCPKSTAPESKMTKSNEENPKRKSAVKGQVMALAVLSGSLRVLG